MWLAAIGLGLQVAGGISGASAQRKSARAQMKALQQEKAWNLGVMQRNKEDVYAANLLSSWGSGIDPTTGSTAGIIASNQQVLQDEIDFQRKQYDIQIANAKAASKQKYLGIF
jgi:K+-transporting ATPase c subunit